MKWLKFSALLLLILIISVAIIPLFISLEDYRPEIEKKASEALKTPVRLKSLKLVGLPLPHLAVTGIEVGKGGDIKVGSVTVTPDLSTLLSDTRVISSINIEDLAVNQAGIDRVAALAGAQPDKKGGPPAVRVREIRLSNATVKMQKTGFGPFDARIALTSAGAPDSARITTRDGKLNITVDPTGKNFNLDIQAKGWRPPVGPPLLFDELLIKGVATLNDANLSSVSARMYGGSVNGKTAIGWQKGLQLKGDYTVNGIELRDLVPLFSPETKLTGRLTAKPVFSANAANADQLKNAMKLDTPFDIRDGVLHGIDIQKAATSLITKDSSGQTRFDALSGHFAMDRGTQHISNLKVVSGSLSADGNVTIAPNKSLSGRINAEVKAGSVAAASVPLNISGTLDEPRALPTGGTVTGAAVGTAILGPGVGTSVGAKVGGWAESLFGGGDKKK